MTPTLFTVVLLGLTSFAYYLGKRRAFTVAGDGSGLGAMHSRPTYYGMLTAIWCGLPAVFIVFLWSVADGAVISNMVVAQFPAEIRALPPERVAAELNIIRNIIAGSVPIEGAAPHIAAAVSYQKSLTSTGDTAFVVLVLCVAIAGTAYAWSRVAAELRARTQVESVTRWFLIGSSVVAIATTIGIVMSVIVEATRFFQAVPITDFLFGLTWSPQMAIRADQVGSSGAFGAVPLFAGTMLISLIAMLVAVPIGLMSAIYLSEYAAPRLRAWAKPLLEILAGIPTVVYGYFAALVVAPTFRDAGASIGIDVASESALAAGLVMGIMIIPFVSSLSDDVINAVPRAMREGSYGLGATKSETIRQVVIPAALPGIVGGVLLAVSRAIGETMIVVMAAGLAANLTANPLQAVTTVTVQIVTLLVGDQEFDSPKTLAAFALGLVLFLVTLSLNVIALHVVRKYREQYE